MARPKLSSWLATLVLSILYMNLAIPLNFESHHCLLCWCLFIYCVDIWAFMETLILLWNNSISLIISCYVCKVTYSCFHIQTSFVEYIISFRNLMILGITDWLKVASFKIWSILWIKIKLHDIKMIYCRRNTSSSLKIKSFFQCFYSFIFCFLSLKLFLTL